MGKSLTSIVAALGVCLSASLAAAQPGTVPTVAPPPTVAAPAPTPVPLPLPPPPPPEAKSPSTAVSIAIAGTVVPLGMFAAASYVGDDETSATLYILSVLGGVAGPSLGHFWVSRTPRTPGMYVRGAAVVALVIGALDGECVDFGFGPGCGNDDGLSEDGKRWVLGAGALYLVGSALDIALVGPHARRWNRDHAVQVAPMASLAGGAPVAGLAVGGRF